MRQLYLEKKLFFFIVSDQYVTGSNTARHTVGQNPQKCKETSNLMWLSLIWFILVLFVCWNLFWTIANLRIKCVTETKNVSVLFYKNLKSSFSTWLTHLTLRFLYILGCSGPRCGLTSKSLDTGGRRAPVNSGCTARRAAPPRQRVRRPCGAEAKIGEWMVVLEGGRSSF